MNSKYYLIINNHAYGIPQKINNRQEFMDITEIDLVTQEFSREEILTYFGYELEKQSTIDIYIMRVKATKEKYNVKFYDCIFKGSKISLAPLQKWRLQKIQMLVEMNHKGEYVVGDAPEFETIIKILIANITGDRNILGKLVMNNNILFLKLNDILENIYRKNSVRETNRSFQALKEVLSQYKNLRGLFIEYLDAIGNQSNIVKSNKCNREESLYDSVCFQYNESFPISIYNANNDPQKKFFIEYMPQINSKDSFSMEEATALYNLSKTPFDNEEVSALYRRGGIEAVMENMDLDFLGTLSLNDSAKLGIISEKEYLKRMGNSTRRN